MNPSENEPATNHGSNQPLSEKPASLMSPSCTAPGCCGGPSRREFFQVVGLAGATALASGLAAAAEPSRPGDFERLIPADKKLKPDWVKSLFERGGRTVYRGQDLQKIGMPVGGICAGQLYLGGDGKLWHWDIFNHDQPTGDSHYAHPPLPASPLDQGFALRVTAAGKTQDRLLDRTGFGNISFCGEYPIGFVEYRDEASPVSISLEAFSPFIPLNPDDSGLPATVLQFKVKNTGADPVEAELAGWLENAVCLYSGKDLAGARRNRVLKGDGWTFLECSAEPRTKEKEAHPPTLFADFGTMGLALLDARPEDRANASLAEGDLFPSLFAKPAGDHPSERQSPFDKKLRGSLSRKLTLDPGQEATVTFVVAWYFPHLRLPHFQGILGRDYGNRFTGAAAVVEYLAKNQERLAGQTRLWHRTWYDSTLPYWFLDRTFANTCILATSTCYRFKNGRFYGWEGVGCCEGTCTHVWHYAQAVARLFPPLERSAREMVDFGIAFDPQTGMIHHRGEWEGPATDGQAGTILRAYREHQMSADDAFLKRTWPRVKKSLQYLVRQDGNDDGILEGAQHNTLDSSWYGPVAWLSSLYLAALRAGEEMAREMGDGAFAGQARTILDRGCRNLVERLWNGEYFIQKPDPQHPEAMRSGNGCEIDQVFGQSWAFQVGLGRLISEGHVKGALRSLWKYNFTTDVGPFRSVYKNGRWYAMPGEGGLIMCTFPKGGGEDAGGKVNPTFAGYFNECMNGFEYQVAGHMIWEGLVQEGLAVCRALHDRYHASRRNPWNEVECGDHYARSMASYGVFLALCGYEHHGPKGHLGFAPRLTPEDFRAPFTAAEGWGTFTQKREGNTQSEKIEVHWGKLRLRTLAFVLPSGTQPAKVNVTIAGKAIEGAHEITGDRVRISFPSDVELSGGQSLHVLIT